MRRARIASGLLTVLVVLALMPPERVFAGPPEGVSGKMVFDEVADGLRRYRREMDARRRSELLSRLAPSRDPRVAVVLGDAIAERSRLPGDTSAYELLYDWFLADEDDFSEVIRSVRIWWAKNEGDLRRRAKQLPQ
jgi:hypothetical protein